MTNRLMTIFLVFASNSFYLYAQEAHQNIGLITNCFRSYENRPAYSEVNMINKHFVVYDREKLSSAQLIEQVKSAAKADANALSLDGFSVKRVCYSDKDQAISFMVKMPYGSVEKEKIYSFKFQLTDHHGGDLPIKFVKAKEVAAQDSYALVVEDSWRNADELKIFKTRAELIDVNPTITFLRGVTKMGPRSTH